MLSTDTVSLNPNPLVQALGKPAKEFRKRHHRLAIETASRCSTSRYVGGDGHTKTLNFAIQGPPRSGADSRARRRVSSCSHSSASSDLYVVPRVATAF